MDTEAIIKKLDRAAELPTLPAIAIEVNKLLQDYENTNLRTLKGRIEKDQVIIARILKLANSAFFGARSRVTSLSHAITLLGFNTIRNAIVSVSIIDALSTNGETGDFDVKDFWKHSVSVAVVSRYIAEQTRLYSPDDCFIGGLLHDIGKIVMLKYFPDDLFRVLRFCREEGRDYFEAEKELTSVNHAYIGYYLAKKWQLPISLAEVIRYHHTISKNAREYNFMVVVSTANIILNLFDAPDSGDRFSGILPELNKPICDIVEKTQEWFPVLSEIIESACSFFMNELKE